MNKMAEKPLSWEELQESTDLTSDLLTIYDTPFFDEFAGYFDAGPNPIDLVKGTLDTACAYVRGWHEKMANRSDFGIFSGRHILKAGIAARNLEYSLRQLSKSELAAWVLNRNLEAMLKNQSKKNDLILELSQSRCGPAHPLEAYRIIADAIARAANAMIPLPDEDEEEHDYIARGDALSKHVIEDKWSKIRRLPSHHALQCAALAFKPIWERHSNYRYYKGRYDEAKEGFHSRPASALQFVIRKIDPDVKLTLVGTAIGKVKNQL